MILAVSVALVMVDLTSLILPEEDLFPFSSSFCKTETILINNDFENTHPKTICFQNLKVSSVKLSQPLASYCSLLLPKLGQVPVSSICPRSRLNEHVNEDWKSKKPFRVLGTIQVVLTVSHQHQNSTGLEM